MQKQIQKNKYQEEFSFLYDLINDFTKKLEINNKLFYFLIQREIKGISLLQGFAYNKNGLSSNKELFKLYKKKKQISEIAPYLASFSRLLSYIYHKSVSKVGEEKAEHLLDESINNLKKKYSVEPNLEGYVPREAIGKAATVVAFDVSLMDNMLNYMLNDVIKKGITPTQRKLGEGRSKIKLDSEELRKNIRNLYLQYLGPLGGKQLEKLGEDLNKEKIFQQIDGWMKKGILNEEKAKKLKYGVETIYSGGGAYQD